MNRCSWCNPNNPLYIEYHDHEWGRLRTDDQYLFEMLILESFQAGLSWECVLNKRAAFRRAYDDFDLDTVCGYGEEKTQDLLNDPGIIRNRLKIRASIRNAQIFREIAKEYGSFYAFLKSIAGEKVVIENDRTTNAASDEISAQLYKRGMRFVGSTIIYAYLQAVGMIDSHMSDCDLYKGK